MSKIIAFEGIDNSGKTTHMQDVIKALKAKKKLVGQFSIRSQSYVANHVIKAIGNTKNHNTKAMLYSALRMQNAPGIELADEHTDYVFLDRSPLSNLVYLSTLNINMSNRLAMKLFQLESIFYNIDAYVLSTVPKDEYIKRLKLDHTAENYEKDINLANDRQVMYLDYLEDSDILHTIVDSTKPRDDNTKNTLEFLKMML